MKMSIDLGKTAEGLCNPVSAPVGVGDKYYPSIYIDRDTPLDLPDSGKLTVTYKLRSKSERKTTDKAGESEHYSYEIEIQSIDGVDADEAVNSKRTPMDELDARIKKHMAKMTGEED